MKYFFYPFFRYHQIFITSIMLLFMSMPGITNAQTALGLRAGLPSFSNLIREHVNSVWETNDPFIRWSVWGNANYTNLLGENIELRNDSTSESFEEDVSLFQYWAGGDFHLFKNLLIGVVVGYENATYLFTNQDPRQVTNQDPGQDTFTPRELESIQDSAGGGIYVGLRFEESVLSIAGVGMSTNDRDYDLDSQRMMLSASLTFTKKHPEQEKIRIKGVLSGMWAQQFFQDDDDLEESGNNIVDQFENIVDRGLSSDEDSISFGRIMAGLEMGIDLAPLEDELLEVFLMINGEYNNFEQEDDYNILYPDTEDQTFGANIGGGVNVHLGRLNVRVLYSYLEILSENFSGYTLSGNASYKWSESLLFFFSANHRQQSDTVFVTKMQWSF